jgi:type II secretory pathway pseudopilin PulG
MIKIKKTGFSLLEILIYVTIIAVATLAIGGVFLALAQGQAKADVRAEINSNLRFALDKINQDILSASAIVAPAIAGGTADSLAMTIAATTVTYCLVNGQLRRAAGGLCDGTAEPITSGTIRVDHLAFTRLENTNTVLSKTIVSLQTVLTVSYNGANPNYQSAVTKQITSSLR